jgi:molybdopterin-dependent oxidoreductase-like protein protein
MRRGGSGRRTNLALLATLGAALATGAGSFATGASTGRWVIWAHGIAGLGLLVLAPWKTRIVKRGVGRRRPGVSASLILAVLVVVAVATGVAHSTGVLVTVGSLTAMQVHVGAALAALPLAAWHVIARPARPRGTDLSRRVVLRTGAFLGVSGAAFAATEGLIRVTGLPGADRRFTGSYERGSFEPGSMPVTQWLNDRVPSISVDDWRLTIALPSALHELTYGEIGRGALVAATLDCTGGWFAEQEWEGTHLGDLIDARDGRSVLVRSVTGFQRRFPTDEAAGILLATHVGGEPLSQGHGFPVRLVVPGRRGFWWVKWVERIEISDTPAWWQPPFPVA